MPLPLKTSAKTKKSLFSRAISVEYSISAPLSKYALPDLVQGMISQVLPKSALRGELLHDFKGRDKHDLIREDISEAIKPRGDELVFVAGKVFSGNSRNELELKTTKPVPFQLELLSSFHDFGSSNHISHAVREVLHVESSYPLHLVNIGRVFPVEIEVFRMGVELFRSKSISSLFGFTPTVWQTLLLEANQEVLEIRINAEGLPSKATTPLEAFGVFDGLAQALMKLFSFDLLSDYFQQLG